LEDTFEDHLVQTTLKQKGSDWTQEATLSSSRLSSIGTAPSKFVQPLSTEVFRPDLIKRQTTWFDLIAYPASSMRMD